MSPEAYQAICQVARFIFAFTGVLILIGALAWLIGDKHEQKESRHSSPSAGTVGELVVITGSRELPAQTWFPVIRDGVLGSVRSCDLVVPCSGVRSHHLDFCWRDGVGLLIRPRSGCEVQVDGISLDCRSDSASAPMIHGSSLTVGSAVLRLHLFAALDHTSASRAVQEPDMSDILPPSEPYADPDVPATDPAAFVPAPASIQNPVAFIPAPMPVCPAPPPPFPVMAPPQDGIPVPPGMPPAAENSTVLSVSGPDDPAESNPPAASRPRRADRWKEDWSE